MYPPLRPPRSQAPPPRFHPSLQPRRSRWLNRFGNQACPSKLDGTVPIPALENFWLPPEAAILFGPPITTIFPATIIPGGIWAWIFQPPWATRSMQLIAELSFTLAGMLGDMAMTSL